MLRRQAFLDTVGPFNHGYAGPEKILVRPEIKKLGHITQSINIEVKDRDLAGVFVNQYKSGADNCRFMDAAAPGDALNQSRLSRTERPHQPNDRWTGQTSRHNRTQSPCLNLRVRHDGKIHN
jgi:hypothetical protein